MTHTSNLLKRAETAYPCAAVLWDFKNVRADALNSLYMAGLIEEPRITKGSLWRYTASHEHMKLKGSCNAKTQPL